ALNVRDDREAPLLWARDARMIVLICPTAQEERLRHSGTTGSLRMAGMRAPRSTVIPGHAKREPGISRFRARRFASPRNDGAKNARSKHLPPREVLHQRADTERPRLAIIAGAHAVGELAEARRGYGDDVVALVGKALARCVTVFHRREHRAEEQDEAVG